MRLLISDLILLSDLGHDLKDCDRQVHSVTPSFRLSGAVGRAVSLGSKSISSLFLPSGLTVLHETASWQDQDIVTVCGAALAFCTAVGLIVVGVVRLFLV
jgi:hypothetical protein